MLMKFWSSFLKYPRKAFPLRYGSCLRSLRRVSAVSGLPKLTSDTFRNSPKLSSISEIPEAPRPAWNSRPPGKDGGANTPEAQDNAGTEHEGAEVVVCDSLRALFVEGRMEVEMKK